MSTQTNHTIDQVRSSSYGYCSAWSVWTSVADGLQRVVSFPFIPMGQYFKAINTDKKEYVCPWCCGGGAKLWEWAANPHGAVFTLLLRRSSGEGGGDFHGRPRLVHNIEENPAELARSLAKLVQQEGQPTSLPSDTTVGRWAGDCVMLIGDYDSSELYDQSNDYRNITDDLIREWNSFMDLDDMKLRYTPCGCDGSD